MTVLVNGKEIGTVVANKSMTIEEAMYALGYDIEDQDDCQRGYETGIEGFYLDDCGNYAFDTELAELA